MCIIHICTRTINILEGGVNTLLYVMSMCIDASQYTLIGADRKAFFALFLSTGDVENSILVIRDEGIVSRVR